MQAMDYCGDNTNKATTGQTVSTADVLHSLFYSLDLEQFLTSYVIILVSRLYMYYLGYFLLMLN